MRRREAPLDPIDAPLQIGYPLVVQGVGPRDLVAQTLLGVSNLLGETSLDTINLGIEVALNANKSFKDIPDRGFIRHGFSLRCNDHTLAARAFRPKAGLASSRLGQTVQYSEHVLVLGAVTQDFPTTTMFVPSKPVVEIV